MRVLLRAAYMAQEILTTFTDDIRSVTLQPSEIGGSYKIFIDEKKIFDRKEYNGFPEIKEIKQWVRDVVNPEKNLGHADRKAGRPAIITCNFSHNRIEPFELVEKLH
jgi:selenoprotein W-related protein